MANAREIQTRMNSIRDTMKITSAMYMISSSKLRKAKIDFDNAIPHFKAIEEDISRLQRHMPETENMYFRNAGDEMDQPRVGYVIITADKGLAGAYNLNVLKLLMSKLEENPNQAHKIYVVGQIGRNYLQKRNVNIDEHFMYTAQNPSVHRARVISGCLLESYKSDEVDEIHLIFTRMKNAIETEAVSVRLLPLERTKYVPETGLTAKDDFEYLPSPEDVFHSLIPNYLTGYIYGALVESYSCEQNARMTAMQAATDNARDMLRTLQIDFNRARQSAITQQITEVTSGAKAQKRKRMSKS